jgi:structural maintenance of chromosome 3 (chondroitin sulfate proteoglycan 6)
VVLSHLLGSLFHVVVDTDNTASQVLDIMLKEKTGRVTFMPLNRLKPKHPAPPNAQDAIPLIDKLRFDNSLVKAFQQVFGKTCVCRDLTIAASYVKSHGINTITLDGDKVDRKGALTGGYHDIRRSRIEAVKDVQSWRSKYEADEQKSKEVKAAITQIEQQITRVVGEISVITSRQNQTRDSRERLLEEGNSLTRHIERQRERVLRLESEVDDLEADLTSLSAKLETLRTELAGPMTAGLTSEEKDMIDVLGREVERRRKDVVEMGRAKNAVRHPSRISPLYVTYFVFTDQLEGRKNALEIELNEKLKRRRDELQSALEALDVAENDGSQSVDNLAIRTRELKNLHTSIATLQERISGA